MTRVVIDPTALVVFLFAWGLFIRILFGTLLDAAIHWYQRRREL